MENKDIKNIELTLPQLIVAISKQKKKYLEWGRAAGKSTILGYFMREFVVQMPRASFGLVGSTYSQILSRTLPSTIEGLEMFNIYQDVDYVVGRSGKKNGFAMPFQPPNQWNNVMHFSNGAIFQLVSLDNPNTGRGLNSYGIIGDEAALLDTDKLYNNVKTTNRAKKKIFDNCSMLGSEIYASSTPITKKGKWFTEMEVLAKENPELYLFSKATAFSNPHIRKEWFEEMRNEAPSELLYNAEILNIRPREITDGFYANLTADHYYTDYSNSYLETVGVVAKSEHFNCNQDNDVISNNALIVSLDFGVFNSCVVSQLQDDKYRVLKSFWVKSPKLLDDLFIEQFIPYYAPHKEKRIYLYGGHDGNNKLPNSSRTLFEQVMDVLRAHGWSVHLMTHGAAATHMDKYLLINAMLKRSQRNLPSIHINEHNNKDLIIGLERAEAKEGMKGVEKDKSPERNKSMLQQHTTHLPDAFDMPIVAMFNETFKGQRNKHLNESQITIS
jgi:hypothetical protein